MIGREAIARFIGEGFGRLFVTDVDIAFTTMLADGDQMVVEERMRATLVNGRRYDNSYCFIFTVRDGAIAQVREYMDTAKGKRQISATRCRARSPESLFFQLLQQCPGRFCLGLLA